MQDCARRSANFGTLLVLYLTVGKGLKFRDLLPDRDLDVLERALDPEAERSSKIMGYTVVKRIVEQGFPLLTAVRGKPGPKKASSSNATDKELSRLLQNARAIMGLSKRVSRQSALGTLTQLNEEGKELCMANTFF